MIMRNWRGTQWLRTLTALVEDLGVVSSYHMVVNALSAVPGDLTPSLGLQGYQISISCNAYTQAKHLYTYK